MNFLRQCAEVMNNYRQLTQDSTYGSRVHNGKMQLVRTTYDDTGHSTVEECSDWIPASEWLDFMRDLCADGAPACPECARSFGPHYTGPCEH